MKTAILSDAHGNWPALRSVLAEIDRLACDRIISLGDVTGYYAQPAQCLDALVQRDAIQLLGNHDGYLVAGTACDRSPTVARLIAHQRREINGARLERLRSFQPRFAEGGISCVHGSWRDPLDEYLYRIAATDLPDGHRYYFAGHTHVQHLAAFPTKTFCNPGAVGQPRDGDPRAAFAVLDEAGITLHRVAYDIEETARAMRAAGYDEPRLWENLFIGAQIGGRLDQITTVPATP
jgi:diadenosine tetraphosphatase ApaH/serine/threonine PP2A family protein phosphatase